MAELAPGRQTLIVYGPRDEIYASVYDESEARIAIGRCAKRHGSLCGAKVIDGVTRALKDSATNPDFGRVEGK